MKNRKKTLGRLLRSIAFVVLACLLLHGATRVLARKSLEGAWNMTTKVAGFFNEEEESMDVLFLGSSHAYCTFNPLVLWEETGLSSYTFATQQQPLWVTYHYLKEALKTQSPAVVVVDVYMATFTEEYVDEATRHTALDDLPFSLNKAALAVASAPAGERLELLWNLPAYHTRWEELTEADWTYDPAEQTDPLRGYVFLDGVDASALPPAGMGVTETGALTEKNRTYLEKIMDLCAEEDVSLLLCKSPANETAADRAVYNTVAALAAKRGVPFTDFNDCYGDIGLVQTEDFYDARHLNARGAEKFCRWFAPQLAALAGTSRGETDYSAALAAYDIQYASVFGERK